MSLRTVATIMWIIHLQARHFAAGDMKGATALRSDFLFMKNSLKMRQELQHGDVPPELYAQPTSTSTKRTGGTAGLLDQTVDQKKGRRTVDGQSTDARGGLQFLDRDCYHPIIKAALKPVFDALDKRPQVRMMCTKSNIRQEDLFPTRGRTLCFKAQLLGTCPSTCTFIHEKVSDAEAKTALKKLKPIIDKPSLLKVN